jgi:hypothetical protein
MKNGRYTQHVRGGGSVCGLMSCDISYFGHGVSRLTHFIPSGVSAEAGRQHLRPVARAFHCYSLRLT